MTAAGPGESGAGGEPSISVIVPTYNRVAMLGRALNSVFAQKFARFEVIVVNDGSSDATAAHLAQFTDQRFRFIHHPRALGAAAARNAGLALVQRLAAVVALKRRDQQNYLDAVAEAGARRGSVSGTFFHAISTRST